MALDVRSVSTTDIGDNVYIKALVNDGNWHWDPTLTAGGAVHWFVDPAGWGSNTLYNNVVADVQSALAAYASVANINFVQATQASDAEIVVHQAFSKDIDNFGGFSGRPEDVVETVGGYVPGDVGATWIGGVLAAHVGQVETYIALDGAEGDPGQFVNTFNADGSISSHGYQLIVHELGHALGLDHPFSGIAPNYPQSDVFPGVDGADQFGRPIDISQDAGDNNLASTLYTVMSYHHTLLPFGSPPVDTPMAFDIAAVQALYGANTTYNNGANTYVLQDPGVGLAWSCIWDTGGIDQIVYNGADNAVIDLRPATLDDSPTGGGMPSYTYTDLTLPLMSTPLRVYGYGGTIAAGVDIENASGGSGNDSITGNWDNNILKGNDGADTLIGGAGDDWLYGGDDQSSDLLIGGPDGDFMYGGPGGDRFVVDNGNWISGDFVDGGDGYDEVDADPSVAADGLNLVLLPTGATYDAVFSYPGYSVATNVEIVKGGDGNDRIDASRISTTVGVQGGAGDDTFYSGAGSDLFDGGPDTDTIVEAGPQSNYTITPGGPGTHYIDIVDRTTGATDVVHDVEIAKFSDGTSVDLTPLYPGQTFDGTTSWNGAITGTAGVDTVSYANANYAIYVDLAHGYAESLTASPGPKEQLSSIENVTGAPNNLNYLHGDQNNNVLIGGNDFNWFEGGGGNNTLIGGTGTDLADYLGTNGPVTIDLPAGKVYHGNYVDTLSSIEQFRGTTFGDTFTGDAANDYYVSLGGNAKIYGGTGNNWFEVYSGDNTMVGGSGNDKLVAGTGSDVLTGGGGANTFVIGAHGAGHTEITDFNAAAGDRIDFSQDALVKQMSDLTVSDDGHGNAMVSYSASDGTGTIVLDQVAPTAVTAADFLHFTPPPSGQTFDGTAFWGGTLTGTPGVGDTASFASANTGIYVDLTSGLAETDDLSKTEHLISIENVTGSLTAMNTLRGDDQDNILTGGNNFNWFYGGGGNNTLIGGTGTDLADYLGTNGPVTIDLPAGKVYHGNYVDTLSSIEQFRGTTFGDTFTGDAANDYYVSLGGNAKIYGGTGNNWFEVYSGDNTMVGGSGNDKLVAGTGSDVLTGGGGANTFVIGAHGAGHTEITDFNAAAGDRIDFSQDALVKQMSDLTVSDDGHGNAMVSYSASDGTGTIVLDQVAPTAVTAADFLHFTLPPSGEVAADQTIILDSTFSGTVNFLSDTGMLKLENSLSFAGTVAGLRGQDAIDLADIGFGASSTLGYLANADNSGGTLSVGDGTHMANIALLGSYMASSFVAASDGHGGTLISETAQSATQMPVVTQPHA